MAMPELLEAYTEAELLGQFPKTVRDELAALEAAGADWKAIGLLLASAPTAGVSLKGPGGWTGKLWEAVCKEFRSFLCTASAEYSDLRQEGQTYKEKGSKWAIGALSGVIGAKLGVASGVLAPMVIWLFLVGVRIGKQALCTALESPLPPPPTPAG